MQKAPIAGEPSDLRRPPLAVMRAGGLTTGGGGASGAATMRCESAAGVPTLPVTSGASLGAACSEAALDRGDQGGEGPLSTGGAGARRAPLRINPRGAVGQVCGPEVRDVDS